MLSVIKNFSAKVGNVGRFPGLRLRDRSVAADSPELETDQPALTPSPLAPLGVAPSSVKPAPNHRDASAKLARKTVSEKINSNKSNMLNVIKKIYRNDRQPTGKKVGKKRENWRHGDNYINNNNMLKDMIIFFKKWEISIPKAFYRKPETETETLPIEPKPATPTLYFFSSGRSFPDSLQFFQHFSREEPAA